MSETGTQKMLRIWAEANPNPKPFLSKWFPPPRATWYKKILHWRTILKIIKKGKT